MSRKKQDDSPPSAATAAEGEEKEKKPAMVGCTSANFHEASRSEYLAHYVFSSFGTSVPVPRQEDTGLDLYCTLTERVGQRIWPRGYYAVQVKSTDDPWCFEGAESVRWAVEHPLPLFLCVVNKKTATLSVYHTSPRFLVWAVPPLPNRLVMVPGKRGKGYGAAWEQGGFKLEDPDAYPLSSPIVEFTVTEILDDGFRDNIKKVLQSWVESDQENLYRIQAGIRQFTTISEYETNDPGIRGWTTGGLMKAGQAEIELMLPRFLEGLKWLSRQMYQNGDLRGSLLAELLLRHQDALNYVVDGVWQFHLHSRLRHHFGTPKGEGKMDFYSGLDGVIARISDLIRASLEEAQAEIEAEKK